MHKCGKLQSKCSGIKKNEEETMQFNEYPIFFCTSTTEIQKKFHQISLAANNYSNHKEHQEAIKKTGRYIKTIRRFFPRLFGF